jgi:hypothetical protein
VISPTLQKLAERYRRPSALSQVADCEGAPLMQAHVVSLDGEPPTAPEATLGNDGHRFIAEAIEGWKLAQDTGEHGACWGDTIALARNEAAAAGLDSWTVRCIQSCLEFARDLIAKHEIEPDNVLTERPLDRASLGFERKGTADLVLVIPGQLVIVVDWKLGFIDQGEADDHDQTQAYAAAAAETFDAKEVLVWLVQPRAPKEHRRTAATYDADTLRANRAWTVAVLNRSRSPAPQLRAGYSQCVHCKALTRCPEARRYIVDAQEALAVIGAPMTGDGYADLIGAAKLAEKFADTGKELGKAHLLAGNHVPGWKLGAGRNIRSVVDVPAALADLEKAGIKAADLALADALTIKVGNLPDAAEAVIASRITDKLSSPPLTPDKGSRRAA